MTKETSVEIASMAGRILAAGNPLDNDQVVLAVLEGLAEANSGRQAQQALKTMFQPYFENMLSLAASCLSQREDVPSDTILVPMQVDYEKVANAFIGAIEGGYSPWMHSFHVGRDDLSATLRRAIQLADGVWYAEASYWRDGGAAVVKFDKPDEEEGAGNGEITLSQAEIKLGLGIMATKFPAHFADMVNENDDAITHDVFAQCVILGDVIYG